MIRLFVPSDLAKGAGVVPAPDQARYLTLVMRRGVGDEVLLFNGRDGEWRARLSEVSKKGCLLETVEQTKPFQPTPDLELAVALVKRTRLETIVEKAAELGCRRVRLVVTRRTNAERAKLERLRAIAVEASEQTGRLDVPEITEPVALGKLLDGWDPARSLVFCDEAGDDPGAEWGGEAGKAPSALDVLTPQGPVEAGATVLIGPEGGFDPEERKRLRSLPFVTAVGLGPRILRADTAAISALTLWQASRGDWR